MIGTFPRHCYSRFTIYEPMYFSSRRSRKICRKGRRACTGVGAKAKQPGPSVHDELSGHRRPLKDESFSLTIRAGDGRTLLETRVEYMHQAFQRLIDWSIGETGFGGYQWTKRLLHEPPNQGFGRLCLDRRRPDVIGRVGVSVGRRLPGFSTQSSLMLVI